jgi:integrase
LARCRRPRIAVFFDQGFGLLGTKTSPPISPLLHRPECKALWVSSKEGALSASAFRPIMARYTDNRLGMMITLHDARDAAATTWAIAAPDQIGVARDLLAHSDLRTTTKYYNRAKGIEASRAHAQVVSKMRKEMHAKT